MGWGKGEEAGGGGSRGVRRGWCVVAMETPSPSLIIIWGKMARGLLPRITPPPPFLPAPLSPSLPLPYHRGGSSASSSSASTSPSFYVLHLALLFRHLLPHLPCRLLLLRLLLLIRLHLAVSSHRGTYFARLGNIMLAPYRGDCVTILNLL